MLRNCSVFFICWLLLPVFTTAPRADERPAEKVQKLVIPYQVETTNAIHLYVVRVLDRALQVTSKDYGAVELVAQEASTVQSRQLRNLNKGLSDIIWMINNTLRDRHAIPVPIPLIGGLYGYRVLLVHRQNTAALSLNRHSLRALTFTQGPDWPDLEILRANDLKVEPSPYKAGFRLVREGYVDAYPRAVHEALLELAQPIGENLTIAPNVLLRYDNPLFFYVARSNHRLAERLKQGLETLIRNGELQALLQSQPFYREAMSLISGRKEYQLQNPFVSLATKASLQKYLRNDKALAYEKTTPDYHRCSNDDCEQL